MTSYSELLRSGLFTFLLGKDEEPIIAHAAVIANQSKAFDTLINGSMAEAQNQSALLRDVSVEDFLKFCEFAYTGDYSTPLPSTRQEETSSSSEAATGNTAATPQAVEEKDPPATRLPPSPPPEEDPWYFTSKKKVKKPSKTAIQRTSFDNQVFCPVLPRQQYLDACQITINDARTEDYTPVFLAHARLYVLADTYGVESLKSLCLHKLHRTLVDLTLFDESMGDIAELIRFSYCDDHTPDDANDALRALVLKFVASRHDDLSSMDTFLSLVEEGGPFMRDLWIFTEMNLI